MSGSSTILQALLPGRSGEVAQRGNLLKKGDQSFAAVFEKKLQVRQEKPMLPPTASDVKDRQRPLSERQDQEQAVDRTRKTEKPAAKNPAKEKMKELVKKVKDTLEAMKDPEATPDQLKKLASDLKEALTSIQELADTFKTEGTASVIPESVAQAVETVTETLSGSASVPTALQIPTENSGEEPVKVEKPVAVQTSEPRGRLQTQELKGNPILKDFEQIMETQSDILSEDPVLKEILKQALAVAKTVLDSETKQENGVIGEIDDLIGKLNGIVVKTETTQAVQDTADPLQTSEITSDETPAAAVSADTSDTKDQQQTPPEDSNQSGTPQDKQVYAAETPVDEKNTDKTEQPRTTEVKHTAGIEKPELASSKPVVQNPAQGVQNPQAFQDTLEAVKDGVQAKNQFQSRIMEQVVETIKMNFKADDGKSEMLMKLKPESLGNVALKVSIDKGIVLAELQVDSQAVKQALESNLQDLRSALQDKGFNVFDLDVSVRKDNQQHGQDSGKRSNNKAARLEGSVERIEKRMLSLESAYHQSTIDYLG